MKRNKSISYWTNEVYRKNCEWDSLIQIAEKLTGISQAELAVMVMKDLEKKEKQ